MAKQPKQHEDAASVAERETPGWKAVPSQLEEAPAAGSARVTIDSAERRADAILPPMTRLRRKYLGDEGADVERDAAAFMDAADAEETEIVELESGELRKSVGVRHGKVVWRQG